jgi:hypothetical protein
MFGNLVEFVKNHKKKFILGGTIIIGKKKSFKQPYIL